MSITNLPWAALEALIKIDSPISIAVALLLIHFIGDFIFQSTDMAINKAKSLKWLTIHVSVYTGILFIGSLLLFGSEPGAFYALVNGGIHWVTDFFTSKLNAALYEREDKRWFFTGVGFDQFIHGASLLITLQYLVLA